MSVSVVIPCYNEGSNVDAVVRDVVAWMRDGCPDGDVIIVDDGSSDDTGAVLGRLVSEGFPLRVVTHGRNRGYGAAIASGCDVAAGDYMVVMDGDGQFRARDIALLLSYASSAAVVTGYREHRADGLLRRLLAGTYNAVVRIMFGIRARDLNCGMKLFPRALWPQVRPRSDGGAFWAEFFLRLRPLDVVLHEVPVSHFPRLHGESTGANPGVVWRIVKDLFYLARQHH